MKIAGLLAISLALCLGTSVLHAAESTVAGTLIGTVRSFNMAEDSLTYTVRIEPACEVSRTSVVFVLSGKDPYPATGLTAHMGGAR